MATKRFPTDWKTHRVQLAAFRIEYGTFLYLSGAGCLHELSDWARRLVREATKTPTTLLKKLKVQWLVKWLRWERLNIQQLVSTSITLLMRVANRISLLKIK